MSKVEPHQKIFTLIFFVPGYIGPRKTRYLGAPGKKVLVGMNVGMVLLFRYLKFPKNGISHQTEIEIYLNQ